MKAWLNWIRRKPLEHPALDAAEAEAQAELAQARADRARAREVVEESHNIYTRNHVALALKQAFGGPP